MFSQLDLPATTQRLIVVADSNLNYPLIPGGILCAGDRMWNIKWFSRLLHHSVDDSSQETLSTKQN